MADQTLSTAMSKMSKSVLIIITKMHHYSLKKIKKLILHLHHEPPSPGNRHIINSNHFDPHHCLMLSYSVATYSVKSPITVLSSAIRDLIYNPDVTQSLLTENCNSLI